METANTKLIDDDRNIFLYQGNGLKKIINLPWKDYAGKQINVNYVFKSSKVESATQEILSYDTLDDALTEQVDSFRAESKKKFNEQYDNIEIGKWYLETVSKDGSESNTSSSDVFTSYKISELVAVDLYGVASTLFDNFDNKNLIKKLTLVHTHPSQCESDFANPLSEDDVVSVDNFFTGLKFSNETKNHVHENLVVEIYAIHPKKEIDTIFKYNSKMKNDFEASEF